jgi:hypothetical protein
MSLFDCNQASARAAIKNWLHHHFHSSVKIGPFYVSTWDWEEQHRICCHP